MARILWTPQAVSDLERAPASSQGRILARVELLAEFPQMGARMDGPYEGYRQFLVARYRVIYRIIDDEVRIAYIRHGARQLGLRPLRGRS